MHEIEIECKKTEKKLKTPHFPFLLYIYFSLKANIFHTFSLNVVLQITCTITIFFPPLLLLIYINTHTCMYIYIYNGYIYIFILCHTLYLCACV